jgi:hypothetical protein
LVAEDDETGSSTALSGLGTVKIDGEDKAAGDITITTHEPKSEKPPLGGAHDPVPGNVSGLSGTAGNGKVTLRWTDPADADLDHIEITFSPTVNGVTQPVSVDLSNEGGRANNTTINGLANDTEYTFTVTAVDTTENRSAGATVMVKLAAYYTININTASNGTVTADTATATAGTTVTLTVTPAGNYLLKTDTLMVNDGNVAVTTNGGNTYTFTMPATDVDVTAEFAVPQYGWNVTTIAGFAQSGFLDNDVGTQARFDTPRGVITDGNGNLYVADSINNRIRKIANNSDRSVSTIAGDSRAEHADGTGTTARFNSPWGITEYNGDFYVTDANNHRIRKMTYTGGQWSVTTIAGSGTAGHADGTGSNASFKTPRGITADSNGNFYITDVDNYRIRKMTCNGGQWEVTTIAGSTRSGYIDDADGLKARFLNPGDITEYNGDLYVADSGNHRIRKITYNSGTQKWSVTTIAGSSAGHADSTGTAAKFNMPSGITEYNGDLYIADSMNHRIRKMTYTGGQWSVTTIAGSGTAGSNNPIFNDNIGPAAKFNMPYGITTDSAGSFYVTDTGNNWYYIRKLSYEVTGWM